MDYQLTAASWDDLLWIAELEARVYSPEDAIPAELLSEWYRVNPFGFFVLRSPRQERVGHLDLLPLRPSVLQRILQGDIRERDIRGESLFPPQEREQIRTLYVESIAIDRTLGHASRPILEGLETSFLPAIGRLCEPSRIDMLYAIAVSEGGARLLMSLGFHVADSASRRGDGHDLYAASFADAVSQLRDRFPHRRDVQAQLDAYFQAAYRRDRGHVEGEGWSREVEEGR